MSDIKSWSPLASGNDAAAPDGFPEGMAPGDVNNAAREVMAAIRRQHEQAEWIDLGHAPAFASASSFTVAGDVTSVYHAGRRVRLTDAGTLHGRITASSYSAPSTTVELALDGGSLSASLSAVAVAAVSGTGGNRSVTPESIGAAAKGVIADADGDTKVEVEKFTDEDIIRFSTTGTERMLINSAGNIGIGTDHPNADASSIQNNSTGLTVSAGTSGNLTAGFQLQGFRTFTNTTFAQVQALYGTAETAAFRFLTENGSNNAASVRIDTHNGTSVNEQMRITSAGVLVGTPSGGAKGIGTINAQAVYDDNALLSCYVLETARGEVMDVSTWDDIAKGRHRPARSFAARKEQDLDPERYAAFWKGYGHLPNMPSQSEWIASGPLSVGDLIQRLWEAVEVHAVHIDKINSLIKALQTKSD